jgi:hypothetical protein
MQYDSGIDFVEGFKEFPKLEKEVFFVLRMIRKQYKNNINKKN